MVTDIDLWRNRRLLKTLRNSSGSGTSMISLIIPPTDQLSRCTKLLTEEYGTASNIKSRVNRLSVLSAITSAQQKLKLYRLIPVNGLAIYTGTIMIDNKEKKVSYAIEPIKPINTSKYLCDSRFHVEPLLALFENESVFGYLVVDGHGALFATLQGNTRKILQTITVSLPKKHSRGGQSSVRFARLRVEKRTNWVRKVCEVMTALFLTDAKVNVEGLVLAGHAEFKQLVFDELDNKLKKVVLKLVDTNYGLEVGLNEAIEKSLSCLQDVKYGKEKKVLNQFFEEISSDGRYVYGFNSVIECLKLGAVEVLIVFEESQLMYEGELFVDWIAERYGEFNCRLEMVSDKSAEGCQFVEGFGGVGGILKYKMEIDEEDVYEEIDSNEIF